MLDELGWPSGGGGYASAGDERAGATHSIYLADVGHYIIATRRTSWLAYLTRFRREVCEVHTSSVLGHQTSGFDSHLPRVGVLNAVQ